MGQRKGASLQPMSGNTSNRYWNATSDRLDAAFDKDELRILSTDLGLVYDDLPGKSKRAKAHALVTSMRYARRSAELLQQCNQRRPDINWAVTPHPKDIRSRYAWNPFSRRISREQREQRRKEEVEGRKRFLRELFDGRSITFEDELCQSWEVFVTQFLYRFFPHHVKKEITYLAKQVNGIDYLDTSGIKTPENLAFVNYHSVCLWYRILRFFCADLPYSLVMHLGKLLLPAVVLMFVLWLLMPFLFLGQVVNLADVPVSSDPGLIYSVPTFGVYYVKVQAVAPDVDYHLDLSIALHSTIEPDFTRVKVWPVESGQNVFARLDYDQQHLYQVPVRAGESVLVNPHRWYADTDLDFALLDATMNVCSAISLSIADWDTGIIPSPWLTCKAANDGSYYLRVQANPSTSKSNLKRSSGYGFAMANVIDLQEQEPNDSIETSNEFSINTRIRARTNNLDQDWYRFTAQTGQQLEIHAWGFSESDLSSVTLYRSVGQGYEVVAHSTRAVPEDMRIWQRIANTSYGRAVAVYLALRFWGIDTISPRKILEGVFAYSGFGLVAFVFVLFTVLLICLRIYSTYVVFVSEQRYRESFTVQLMATLLQALGKQDVLRSEISRAGLRWRIELVSEQIYRIPRTSHVMAFLSAPTKMHTQLGDIASQISQMNELISVPTAETLPYIQQKFAEWFVVFLKSEYGSFQFESDFKPIPRPWHKRLFHAFRRHWWKALLSGGVILGLGWLTRSLWDGYQLELLSAAWLVVRYILLMVVSYGVYMRWGAKGPDEKSKWLGAVRLILFFFVPFFALDVLLQTGIVESIIKLVGSLNLF